MAKAVPLGEITQLFFLLIYFLGCSSWQMGWKARPFSCSAEEEEALHQCLAGCLSRQLKLLCAACLGGAVALALCPRQAAGCLQSELSVWEAECETPEGCMCAPASASATHCCTYNCLLTKGSLVLCQEEDGKLEIQRNVLYFLLAKGAGTHGPCC